jgi:hypothetical protein
MTDGGRQLIASRLVDKGLPPYDGGVLDPTALENLTELEREVFGEFFFEEVETPFSREIQGMDYRKSGNA